MKKCIVTVLGEDTVGIIAKVCTYLAENEINILDISQTIVGGFFNMMMIVDVAECKTDFAIIPTLSLPTTVITVFFILSFPFLS